MRRSALLAVVVSFALGAVPAGAFEPEEHTSLSNLALRTALAARDGTEGSDPALRGLLARDPLRSFGAITALADYSNGIDDLFVNPRWPIGLPQAAEDLDWRRAEELRRDRLGFLEALHANRTHFQQAALTTYWQLHDRAKRLAAEGSLFPALVYEAYADHFLQDFYAPGHVMTPRTELVGFASLALHDRGNRRGLPFRVKAGADVALAPLLAALRSVLRDEPEGDPRTAGFDLRGEDLDALAAALMPGAPPLHFVGDGRLATHRVQAAFLVLASADSITEVLASRAAGTPVSDRDDLCFFDGVVSKNEMPSVCGESLAPSAAPGGSGRPAPYTLAQYARTRLGEFGLEKNLPDLFALSPFDLLFVSGFGNWAPRGANEGGTGGVKIESLVSAVIPRNSIRSLGKEGGRRERRLRVPSLARVTALGLSHRRDEGLAATGAQFRYIFPLRGLDLHGYLLYGKERVTASGRSSWNDVAGVGVEVGYGLVYFHLGVESLATRDGKGGLAQRGTVGFGFTVMVPRSAL